MIREMNNEIRIALAALLGLFVLFHFVEKSQNKPASKHGYQTEEFDDIW